MDDTEMLINLLGLGLQLTYRAAEKNGRDMKELGEILLELKEEDDSTEIPKRMIALGEYIITEMTLLVNLLENKVKTSKEKN
jgi:hypothetical protein